MRKIWVHPLLFFVIAALLLLGMAGCAELSREAENSVVSRAQPTLSATPELSVTASPEPTATLPPGIREEARFYADLDGDGEEEAIVISSVENDNPEGNDNISLGVLSGQTYREVHVQEGFFSNAFLTRTQSGDVCLLIQCCDWVGIDEYTTVCSFDSLMPVVHDSLCAWIVGVDGTAVTLGAWADFIGSWNYTCEYALTDDFELIQTSGVMISMENSEPLHTIRELPVELMVDGDYVAGTVPADTLIWPVSSDREGRITFCLEDGRVGRINYTRGEDYLAIINGLGESEYFDNVNYWD